MANIEIYIHIPFCVRKCGYCDFLSAPGTEEQREAYVQALIREIGSAMSPARLLAVARAAERTGLEQESLEQTARGLLRALEDSEVSSVYIGGGTPSILTGEQIWRIMTAVKKTFRMADDCEITMEVNPATVDIQKLSRCRFAGINRVSIGLQSADDKDLAMLGRVHTVEDFEETFRMVREAGFKNVSVDLIHSLPGQTVESWEKSLRFVAHLGPEHISAYSLIIEEGTPFYEKFGDIAGHERVDRVGDEYAAALRMPALPDEYADREMEHLTETLLAEYGCVQYEISNYAKPGFECRHNLGYWSDVPYLGLGLGSSSYLKAYAGDGRPLCVRFSNTRDLTEYLSAAPYSGGCPVEGQILSEKDREEEFFFLGLRRREGIGEADFLERFGHGWDAYLPAMERMEKAGFMESDGAGTFRLTRSGMDVSNAVFAQILV